MVPLALGETMLIIHMPHITFYAGARHAGFTSEETELKAIELLRMATT